MTSQASDTQVVVRFEARMWRSESTGTREIQTGNYKCASGHVSALSATCALCGEPMYLEYVDDLVTYPAQWAVYDAETGVRLKYMESKIHARKVAESWNQGAAPSAVIAKADAALELHKLLKPGDTVSAILRHCSRSGMSQRISLVINAADGIRDITWLAARVMGESIKGRAGYVQDAGITVGGCGMDMGFHLVYNLSSALWPDGFDCIGKGCPSNDHCNRVKAERHESGGYALKQRWL